MPFTTTLQHSFLTPKSGPYAATTVRDAVLCIPTVSGVSNKRQGITGEHESQKQSK